MNEATYRIREFEDRDYAELARVSSDLDLAHVATPEEHRHWAETYFVPPQVLTRRVAEERSSRRAVGFGTLNTDPESYDPRSFWLTVRVAREHQRRGIGRRLAESLNAEAIHRGASRIWSQVRADDLRAVEFFRSQGFVERRRSWRSRLDLAGAPHVPDRTEELRRAGVSFATLGELDLQDPGLVRELHELNNAVSADEPRLSPYTPLTVEQFVRTELTGPAVLPEAYFLARVNDRWVALTSLRRVPADPGLVRQSFTGTLRMYRGRGLATELKRRAVEFARARGFRSIDTGNDSLNEEVLRINRRFGYRFQDERIQGERTLPSSTAGTLGS